MTSKRFIKMLTPILVTLGALITVVSAWFQYTNEQQKNRLNESLQRENKQLLVDNKQLSEQVIEQIIGSEFPKIRVQLGDYSGSTLIEFYIVNDKPVPTNSIRISYFDGAKKSAEFSKLFLGSESASTADIHHFMQREIIEYDLTEKVESLSRNAPHMFYKRFLSHEVNHYYWGMEVTWKGGKSYTYRLELDLIDPKSGFRMTEDYEYSGKHYSSKEFEQAFSENSLAPDEKKINSK